jgi:hypothetical protein
MIARSRLRVAVLVFSLRLAKDLLKGGRDIASPILAEARRHCLRVESLLR